jgi:hypothetical protein
MLAAALDFLSAQVEAAGLVFGVPFDGSSEARRCTIGPVDPDHPREQGIMLGWSFASPVGDPLERPNLSPATITPINPATGAGELEPGLEWASRLVSLHVYLRETRPDHLRTGYDLPTGYLEVEGRILRALGKNRRDWQVVVNGKMRGFSTRFEGNPFVDEGTLAIHSVFQWRVTYPVTEGQEPIPVSAARRIHLVHGLPVGRVREVELDLGQDPLTTPEGVIVVVE